MCNVAHVRAVASGACTGQGVTVSFIDSIQYNMSAVAYISLRHSYKPICLELRALKARLLAHHLDNHPIRGVGRIQDSMTIKT